MYAERTERKLQVVLQSISLDHRNRWMIPAEVNAFDSWIRPFIPPHIHQSSTNLIATICGEEQC
ncbi:hypothetical protein BT69DRAFT_1281086 [Atractiella rhizophila]|nr:hypothetical protein BT69DRAFT_1281086 [Atractiella rhizophila]